MRFTIGVVLFAALAQAETLDRIAVSVGTEVITESAVVLDLRVSAFLDRAPVDLSGAAKRRSAERLAEQVLILREASDSHLALPSAKNADALLEQVKVEYGADYRDALKRYGVEEADVAAQLLAGLVGITFTDLRFRPAVQVSEDEVREFHSKLKDGSTFEATRDDIEALLTRQRISEALDQWLASARTAARVQFREAVFR
jgi:hypothetical protein